jgi:uncharacterized protein YnzC (UPF0291/DUF896 family)
MSQNNEALILKRILSAKNNDLTKSAADFMRDVDFEGDDISRMNELSEKARLGTLSDDELTEAKEYQRVADMIAIFRSKARSALKQDTSAA